MRRPLLRYFFDLRMVDETAIFDTDGIEFTNLAEAYQQAIEAVATMVIKKGLSREQLSIRAVEISDQSGQILSVVPFEGPRIH